MLRNPATMDGNTAVAHVAYRVNEVCAIFPITPSSTMAELADEWSAQGTTNIWGNLPVVQEMQSEGGAAGAVHGALQSGALTTTFTASQGLLLMIPNMFKIAGELTATVFHVAARSIATQALSIFGDHSDVMAVRPTGFALLSSGSVQEAHDVALIAQAATLESRVPFLHFFDGFRTSHEVNTIELLSDEQIRAMIDDDLVRAHRARAINPEHPFVRGTAHNPDTFFQARETVNPYYAALPGIVQRAMDRFAALTGRRYRLFEYAGAPDAERVLVLMGSGAETARETAAALNARGEKVGVLQVRLYRPFPAEALLAALARHGARHRGAGADQGAGQPGRAAVSRCGHRTGAGRTSAVHDHRRPLRPVLEGFRPAAGQGGVRRTEPRQAAQRLHRRHQRRRVAHQPCSRTTISASSRTGVVAALFYGLGSDGTVGANKNSVKIIAEDAGLHAQGYFVYDSHKSGAQTVSHLRFGPQPIHAPYLIQQASFVGVHQFQFVTRQDVLKLAAPGATLLLNAPYGPDALWDHLPRGMQQRIIDLKLKLFVIDASGVAERAGLRGRANTVLQTCFFALSGVLPRDRAIEHIKQAIQKTYARRGEAVVASNFAAVDAALDHLQEVTVPATASSNWERPPPVPCRCARLRARGDRADAGRPRRRNPGQRAAGRRHLAVRHLGLGEAQRRRRRRHLGPGSVHPVRPVQLRLPARRDPGRYFDAAKLDGAPDGFKSAPINVRGFPDVRFTLQFSVEDCTGCGLCVEACPAVSPTDRHVEGDHHARQGAAAGRANMNIALLRDSCR